MTSAPKRKHKSPALSHAAVLRHESMTNIDVTVYMDEIIEETTEAKIGDHARHILFHWETVAPTDPIGKLLQPYCKLQQKVLTVSHETAGQVWFCRPKVPTADMLKIVTDWYVPYGLHKTDVEKYPVKVRSKAAMTFAQVEDYLTKGIRRNLDTKTETVHVTVIPTVAPTIKKK